MSKQPLSIARRPAGPAGKEWAVRTGLAVFLLLPPGAGTAFAAPPPDAGQIMQQMQKDAKPPPARQAPDLAPLPAPMRVTGGPTLSVTAFRFAGNSHLDADRLRAALSEFTGRPLDFNGLQAAAAAVAQAYRDAGWIVRAYLPEQDIVDGIVTIQIVEAMFGGVSLEGDPPGRVPADRLLKTIDNVMGRGDPLNTGRLDRGLLLLGDLPGLAVQGALRRGANDRETDLVLRARDTPLLTGTVTVDNFGARATGMLRGTGGLFVNSALGLGDQGSFHAIISEGSQYGGVGWSLPVGYDGVRIGARGSYLDYKLVSRDFRSLDASGTSWSTGLDANWPMIRGRTANLTLGLVYDHRSFENHASHEVLSDYAVDTVSLVAMGNMVDQLGGIRGVTIGNLSLDRGRVGPGHPDLVDATPDMASTYFLVRASLSREEQLSEVLSAHATVSAQWADRNLDSSERFYLGGPESVRAFPGSEAGGTKGAMVNAQLRWKLPANLVAAAFYDWGRITILKNRPDALSLNSYSLSGAGLGLIWQAESGLTIRGAWAHRLGSNPGRDASGHDQDGTRYLNRAWLSATQPF